MCGTGYAQAHMYFMLFKWLSIPIGLIALWIAMPNIDFNIRNSIGLTAPSIFSPAFVAMFGATCVFIGAVLWLEAAYIYLARERK